MKSKLACPAPVLPGGRFLFPVLTSESRKRTPVSFSFLPAAGGAAAPHPAGEAQSAGGGGGPFHTLTSRLYRDLWALFQEVSTGTLAASQLFYYFSFSGSSASKQGPQSTCLNAAAQAPAMSIGICGGV